MPHRRQPRPFPELASRTPRVDGPLKVTGAAAVHL